MEKETLYVAYGSNLNVRQMGFRCPDAMVVGIGLIRDYKLAFRGVATIEPSKGDAVPVGVWKVSKRDEKALDIYEGYPRLYRKETVEVEMANGETVDAMVYIMNTGRPGMPAQYYLQTIEQGYGDIGLDIKYLEAALRDTEARMKKEK